jgi:hypothetical protein
MSGDWAPILGERVYRREMGLGETIDISFDFRSDTAPGQDPDSHSPTLRRYHQLLWSKPLPSGAPFELDGTTPHAYLHHRSDELGEFFLSSDTVVPTWSRLHRDDTRWAQVAPIIEQIPEAKRDYFKRIGYTIGGMMVFPSNQVAGAMTINQARGCHRSISDRFDLTLECIRRHYLNERSPLSPRLAGYPEFFRLFGDFPGYVSFFHLQDLVNEDARTIKFMMPFDDFTTGPLPRTLDAYLEYRERAIEFIELRNRRIAAHVSASR